MKQYLTLLTLISYKHVVDKLFRTNHQRFNSIICICKFFLQIIYLQIICIYKFALHLQKQNIFTRTSNFNINIATSFFSIDTQKEMMFLYLVNSSNLNSNNLKVIHSSAYANIKCIHQLPLKNILHCYHTFQSTIFDSSD